MSAPAPIIRAAGDGDRRAFLGGGLHTWKLLAEDTDGAFFLLEDEMTGGKTTPLHQHPEADEVAYVLEGEIVINQDGKETRVGAGGMTYTPRGVPHAFLVTSATCRILTFQTPGVGQAFYRDASEPATGDSSDTVDIARLQRSAQDNPRGVQLMGPPPSFETTAAG